MIQHDLDWTMHQMPGYTATVQSLAAEIRRLRADLAAILRAGDHAARGAKIVAVQGQVVVFTTGEKWQDLRRAMIAAGERLTTERGATN